MVKVVIVCVIIALMFATIQKARCLIIGNEILSLGDEAMRIDRSRLEVWRDDKKLLEVTDHRNAIIEKRNELIKKRNAITWFEPDLEIIDIADLD